MCDPVSMGAASAGMGAVQSVMGFMGQTQAARSNAQAANASYMNTYNSEQQQASQVDRRQSENTVTSMINAAAARGRVSASASSMGADAASTTQMVNAADFDVGRALSIEDVNSEDQRVQIGQQLTNANIERQSQINQVVKPSPFSLITNLGADAIQGAGQALKLTGT